MEREDEGKMAGRLGGKIGREDEVIKEGRWRKDGTGRWQED